MAQNERVINATPGAVFRVLSDPRSYAHWVIGSIEIRNADPGWPQVGSRFHHTVGMGPLRIKEGSERTKKALSTVGHTATSVSFGVVRGVLGLAGLGPRVAGAALFGAAMAPELVVVPALGGAKALWKWSAADRAISVLHHGVFTLATNTA